VIKDFAKGGSKMRISSNAPGNVGKLYQTNQTQAAQTELKSGAKPVAHDSVQLSDQAKAIHEMIKETKDLPDIRQDKVAQIKNAITNNTYNVSAQQLAAKMLLSDKE
jgi:negative regulator of flagellin synthesis FlgM